MKAICLIRSDPVYRREAFVSGLKAVGFDVSTRFDKASPGDVLVIWNRYGDWHSMASTFEREGGTVIVTENAYLANDRADRRRYAIAQGGHNGSGFWKIGGPERWDRLGIALAPWRDDGDHVLVCPNRCFGMPGMIMPADWGEKTARRLAKFTKRPVRIRPHPGNGPHPVPLERDLAGAWAVVIWSSSVGCEALVAGVPVFCESPWWIAKEATDSDLSKIEAPSYPDRLPVFQRLAWAQWHIEEIARGEPFQYLRDGTSQFSEGV